MNERSDFDLNLCRKLEELTCRYYDIDSQQYLNILYEAIRQYNVEYGTVYQEKEAVHMFMKYSMTVLNKI